MKVKKFILTFGRTYMKIHTPTMVQEGGGGGRIDPQEFLICYSISKRFYLQQKNGQKWRVTSPTMVAILNFTKN